MKKVASATMKPPFVVEPMSGHHMVAFGSGEYLVINDEETTSNVIIGPDTVHGLLLDLANGGSLDEFMFGYGTMWRLRGDRFGSD